MVENFMYLEKIGESAQKRVKLDAATKIDEISVILSLKILSFSFFNSGQQELGSQIKQIKQMTQM
ncbi:MAG: hypothetical protein HQK77_13855 [Desulfobacterales bacterium]|nr:hypothetical protein [Desulfobacterales bacterium]